MGRDRTAEFMATIKSMAGKPQYLTQQNSNSIPTISGSFQQTALSNPHSQQFASYTEFTKDAKSLTKDLAMSYQKLEKVNLLAQKKTIFDDDESDRELKELTYTINADIKNLNERIDRLRKRQMANLQSSKGRNANSHASNVILNLQQKLASMSKSLKGTLELRTENMKKQMQRREQFTTSASVNSPLLNRAITQSSAPSRSNGQQSLLGPNGQPYQLNQNPSQNANQNLLSNPRPSTTVIDFGEQSSTLDAGQLRQRSVLGNQQQQTQAVLQFQDQSDQYIEDRANTMQSIESTIVELGSIFSQLTTMVHQQEEMITRIDANVTDTQLNVEAAHQSLVQYLQSVTSNRWLMIKIFGVLFAFFLLFVIVF